MVLSSLHQWFRLLQQMYSCVVHLSVLSVMSVTLTLVYHAKAVGQNEMPFGRDTRVVPTDIIIDRGPSPPTWRRDLGVRTPGSQWCRLSPDCFGPWCSWRSWLFVLCHLSIFAPVFLPSWTTSRTVDVHCSATSPVYPSPSRPTKPCAAMSTHH